MGFLDFDIKEPVHLNWTGKFIAPDENWVHISRALTDFELIVMTEGDLYIADTEGEYVIHQGEYRLMCPTSHQYGYHSSQCTFYWTHFSYHNFENNVGRPEPDSVSLPLPAESTHIILPEQGSIPRLDRMIVLFKQLQDCNRKYRNINQDNHTLTAILCELYSQFYHYERGADAALH